VGRRGRHHREEHEHLRREREELRRMHHLARLEGIQDHIEERLQEVRARHHRFGGLHAEWLRYHSNRRSLQRQMFKAFGLAIGLTTAAVGLIVWLVGGGAVFEKDATRAKAYIVHRFEEAWPDPAARAQLVQSLARDMELGVRTFDAHGVELERAGKVDHCRKHAEAPIGSVGRLEVCIDAHRFSLGSPLRGALFLIVPGVVLWGLAGLWARRLARPIAELTRVARDLGEGKLERRARLRHGLSGEVGDLTRAINEMAARLEDKIRAERELLAGVSHELRTPLARVRILTELGREHALGSRDVWSELEVEVGEMDALVGELLASARVDFRALTLRELDAAELARQAIAKHPGVRLELLAGPGGNTRVVVDATLLVRALGALLDNARKHAGGATALRVRGRADGGMSFEVDDAGPGFRAEDLPRVFEPFYRGGGQAHDEARGVGLGLALVRRIAEAHGAKVRAENLTPGARVAIDLPAPRAEG
jgi:two-component system OmpR family sensor kinase